MFLVPIPQGESFTTLLDFLKSWIKGLFGGSLSYIIVVILIVSAIMSTYDYFAKPEWIRKNHYLTRAFTTTPLYLVSKIIGAVFAVMVVFKIGPEVIISADTGATIVDLCGTLFCIVVAFSFIMPFLTDCGIMEFLGVIAKPVVRPPVPCTWKSVRRPDRILVRCIQCSGNPYQRAVHERLLHKKRSRLHYDKLFPCVHSILPEGCGYHGNRKYFPAVLSVHLRGRYHPGSDHRQNPSDPYGAGYLP